MQLYLALGTVVALSHTSPAIAVDVFTVDKSSVSALPVKTKIPIGTRITIPDGESVTLITPKGVQFECAGKYEGSVENCTGPQGCTLLNKILGKCVPAAGGVSAGGTRELNLGVGESRGGTR